MIWSYLPRWKFTDSCGRPDAPGAIHLGCADAGHTACHRASRRQFLKAGVAIVGAAGFSTILDPREVFGQLRVFPPPPPAVSPTARLMDPHAHPPPDPLAPSPAPHQLPLPHTQPYRPSAPD